MNVQKLVGLLVIALLLFFVFTQPTVAASSLQNILGLLKSGAQSVITFITGVI